MKILIINGPNINMLGIREPNIYGRQSYDDLVNMIAEEAKRLDVYVEFYQSNHEGALIDKIQEAHGNFDGIIFNPAAYTHTSIALADAVKAVGIRTVEVHLSDISKRESYRKNSFISEVAYKTVTGKGFDGYIEALHMLTEM
ncbi:MAG: type II 3-dehydroquinate dehydratase [Eubacterium sp.]|nr:type II 3-dehydroquinate dehydratase [Eubacterium sp.]